MSYIGTEPKDIRSFGRTKFDYTATQGQTAFTGADDDGKVLAFTVGQIEVYVNGILMDDSDFTTTGTGTVTLASAANLNDVINIVSFESNIPDNDYVPASGGTFSGNVTNSGNVTVGGTLGVTGATTTAALTASGDVGVATRLQVGDSSITNAYSGNPAFGYVADFQGPSGTQTYISIAAPPASSLGDNGVVIGEDATDTYFTQRGNKNIKLGTQDINRLIIDGSGHVTTPYNPAFSQATYHTFTVAATGTQVMTGSNVWASSNSLAYSSTNSGWNVSTGTFTAPVAGRYIFHLTYFLHGHNSGYWYSYLQHNGSTKTYGYVPQTSTHLCVAQSAIFNMSASDTARAAWTNNYVTGNIYAASFSGYLIG
jgi:hypothetical protein